MECPLPGQIFIMLLALITYFAKKITLDQSVASHIYMHVHKIFMQYA